MSIKSEKPQFFIDDLTVPQVLDTMLAHVWIKDLNGIYVYTNIGSKKSLGLYPEEMIGKSDHELFEPEIAELFLSSDRETFERDEACIFPRFAHHVDDIRKVWSEFVKIPLRNKSSEVIGIIGMSYDTLGDSAEEDHDALYHLAYNDILTGISNRVRFRFELEKMLEECQQLSYQLALVSIDLDFFQRINESYGHLFGDRLLKKFTVLLQEYAPDDALIARIDGDEFAVAFFCQRSGVECVVDWIQELQGVFNKPLVIGKHELRLSVSFGATVFPDDGQTVDELMRNIDAAKTKAKRSGRNRYEFYKQGSRELAARRVEIQNHLHKAVVENNFFLVYQGKYNLTDRKLRGYEALIRLDIPDLGFVSPAEFIPLAESSGLIIDIGIWVLEQACIQGNKWLDEGKEFGHISVNVSVEQLKHQGFIKQVENTLERTKFPTKYLEMEITESVLMTQTSSVIKILHKLRSLGIRLSMDDFGTGYSSLSYLKDLPLNKLKLDRAFIKDLVIIDDSGEQSGTDSSSQAIVEATIALANAFDLELVAEGIEYKEQADRLLELGCLYGQGFLYHKPERFS